MLFRKVEQEPEGPTRPTHFREAPNERTSYNEATLDYPDLEVTEEDFQEYGFEPGGEAPIPVYLTEPVPADRVYRDWSAGTYAVPTDRAVQLGDRDRRRTRLFLRNVDDTNFASLMRGPTDQDFAAYRLEPGTEIELFHTESVWARADTADVNVTVIAEFEVSDDGE